jgi:hypothetical protein
LRQGDHVILSAPGLTHNPDLAGKTGTVTEVWGDCVTVVWDGDEDRECWIKAIYVEEIQ